MKIITQFQCDACLSLYKNHSSAKECENSDCPEIIKGSTISVTIEKKEFKVKIIEIICISKPGKVGHDWCYYFESEIKVGADDVSVSCFYQSEIGSFVILNKEAAKPSISSNLFKSPHDGVSDEVWNFLEGRTPGQKHRSL